jgi:polygalacturonase
MQTKITLASVTLILMVSMGCAAAKPCREVPINWPVQESTVYTVTANGEPLTVRQCDGRFGPASYVHVLVTGNTEFKIECSEAGNKWDLSSLEDLNNVNRDSTTCTFSIDQAEKILVMTEAEERLFIFADAPDEKRPNPRAEDVISVLDYGVKADGSELATEKIQKAINAAGQRSDGGVVFFPAGYYRSGTIRIPSKVTVYLDAGALLRASADPEDFPFDPGTREKPDRTQDIRSRLVLFEGAQGAAIRGRGELDGMGQILRVQHHRVPNLIRVRRSKNINIEGIILRRAAGWNTHIFHSDHVNVDNIKIFSNWSDGIDPDNSRHVTITNSLIQSYDDSLAIKATWFEHTARIVSDIHVKNCVLFTDKSCIKIGTETKAEEFRNIIIEDITVAFSRGAIVIYLRDGATIHDVTYRDIRIKNSESALYWGIRKRHALGRIENMTVQDIKVTSDTPCGMKGHDPQHNISNVDFINYMVDGQLANNKEEANFELSQHVEDLEFITKK